MKYGGEEVNEDWYVSHGWVYSEVSRTWVTPFEQAYEEFKKAELAYLSLPWYRRIFQGRPVFTGPIESWLPHD